MLLSQLVSSRRKLVKFVAAKAVRSPFLAFCKRLLEIYFLRLPLLCVVSLFASFYQLSRSS
jgi:hypothetical protein